MDHGATLVTVLMPCKNTKASFFREALNSVFSQGSPLWNLIVIIDDDHTSTETKAALDLLRELTNSKDTRILVLKNESNLITGTLNTGMKHAKTPYVCSLILR